MAKKGTVTGIVQAPADPFGAIAKPAAPASAKKSEKPTAGVLPGIKKLVDLFLKNKSEIKRIEAEMSTQETSIIDHVRPQQDDLARSGKFTKSLEVPGDTGSVTYVTSDKFSVPKETEAQAAIKKLIGLTNYENWFEVKRTITLKKEMQENTEFIQKLVKALASAGMTVGDAFDVTDELRAKKDLDQKQYELNPTALAEFRTLVRQNKPALK
jgi:hypothetical protein